MSFYTNILILIISTFPPALFLNYDHVFFMRFMFVLYVYSHLIETNGKIYDGLGIGIRIISLFLNYLGVKVFLSLNTKSLSTKIFVFSICNLSLFTIGIVKLIDPRTWTPTDLLEFVTSYHIMVLELAIFYDEFFENYIGYLIAISYICTLVSVAVEQYFIYVFFNLMATVSLIYAYKLITSISIKEYLYHVFFIPVLIIFLMYVDKLPKGFI